MGGMVSPEVELDTIPGAAASAAGADCTISAGSMAGDSSGASVAVWASARFPSVGASAPGLSLRVPAGSAGSVADGFTGSLTEVRRAGGIGLVGVLSREAMVALGPA